MKNAIGIEALEQCVRILGSQSKVAEACGVRQQTVSERLRVGGVVPAEWCIPLEKATRAIGDVITRQQLRPDLYPDESNDDASSASSQDGAVAG